ncbi:MAG: hypothetical protein QXF49_01530 [Thermosphaera sp.]
MKVTGVKFLNVYCVVEMEVQGEEGPRDMACLQVAPRTAKTGLGI